MAREYVIQCDHVTGAVWSPTHLFVDESVATQVVRCRTCAHYHERVNGCDEFGDESRGEFATVEPDGFCAWGERRDA